jgi:hypothetical protein
MKDLAQGIPTRCSEICIQSALQNEHGRNLLSRPTSRALCMTRERKPIIVLEENRVLNQIGIAGTGYHQRVAEAYVSCRELNARY